MDTGRIEESKYVPKNVRTPFYDQKYRNAPNKLTNNMALMEQYLGDF